MKKLEKKSLNFFFLPLSKENREKNLLKKNFPSPLIFFSIFFILSNYKETINIFFHWVNFIDLCEVLPTYTLTLWV